MSTHAKKTAKPVSTVTHPTTSSVASTPAAGTTATTSTPLTFITPPPKDANIPTPPSGAAQPAGSTYSSLAPKATELAALPAAVENLERFTNFAQVFGVAGLPYAQVLQAFDVGEQWSTMRKSTAEWDTYCRTQEGIAWAVIRLIMESLKPLWDIATAADPSLSVTFPALASLFGAKKAIAQKGLTTRRLNKEAVARGEAPTHGRVGKQRKKAADKALAAAAKAAGLTPGSTAVVPAPTPVAAPAPSPAPAVSATAAPATHS